MMHAFALTLLLPAVLALPKSTRTGNLISKRDDYNAIVYQPMQCASTRDVSSSIAKRDGTLISVTVVEGSDPIEGVLNFADFCDNSTAPATSVASTFTVENDCNDEEKTFVVDITDASGNVTSSTFTLNAAWDYERDFAIVRPSTAVITSGTDVITLDYPEYEAVEMTLSTLVWWCDGD